MILVTCGMFFMHDHSIAFVGERVSMMAQQNEVLVGAIRKLALAGKSAGFTVEEMVQLLNTGVSVDTLLNLICLQLESNDEDYKQDSDH